MQKKKVPGKKALEKDFNRMTYNELSEKYGVSEATIGRWLKKYGLRHVSRRTVDETAVSEEAADAVKIKDPVADTDEEASEKPEGDKEDVLTNIFSDRLSDMRSACNEDTMRFEDDILNLDLERSLLAAVEVLYLDNVRSAGDEALYDVLRLFGDELKKEFVPDDVKPENIYNVSEGKYFLIMNDTSKKNAVSKLKDIKFRLQHDYNIYIIFNAKPGIGYTDIWSLRADVEYSLDYLARNAVSRPERASSSTTRLWQASERVRILDHAESAALQEPPTMSDLLKTAGYLSPMLVRRSDDVDDIFLGSSDDTGDVKADIGKRLYAHGLLSMTAKSPAIETETAEGPAADNDDKAQEDAGDDIKTVFLIDSENVSSSWRHLLDGDTSKLVKVLYTDQTPKMSYDDMADILKEPSRIEMEKVYAGEKGASALDFQLVSMLGFMLCGHPEKEYVIVSGDKGYIPVARYWADRGYHVKVLALPNRDLPGGEKAFSMLDDKEKTLIFESCRNPVQEKFHMPEKPVQTEPLKKMAAEKTDDGKHLDKTVFLQKVLPGRKKDVYEKIIKILDNNRPDNLTHIRADFIDIFGSQQGGRLYKLVKKKIRDYKAV